MRAPTKRARDMVALAERLGFRASRTRKGHLKFSRPGHRPVFTGGTPSDTRTLHNLRAELRRSLRDPL